MDNRDTKTFFKPIGKRLNNLGASSLRRSAEAILRPESSSSVLRRREALDSIYDDDNLAPVMPAIDAVQQLMDEEIKTKKRHSKSDKQNNSLANQSATSSSAFESPEIKNQILENKVEHLRIQEMKPHCSKQVDTNMSIEVEKKEANEMRKRQESIKKINSNNPSGKPDISSPQSEVLDEDESLLVRNSPFLTDFSNPHFYQKKQDEYEFVPKSIILDVYSNDPEVKRFLKQLPKIGIEYGYNEQDYKCYSCRRPIGMVFGQPKLCHYDGHYYCSECHLGEKSTIPARILCNWDFNTYPISKRNQHFLTLISNEPMFELKTMAPLLYKTCPELKEIEDLRHQAFSIRSYCFTCVQDSISFELTKLVWPREHLMKQIDQYSLEDLIQIKGGGLKTILKNVISFGKQHVLSCMLCCQKGFICELCKSSQIIYPFDTESTYRCHNCQSIYHKTCFISRVNCDDCPRCLRLRAREQNDF